MQQRLVELGEDFYGVVEGARHELGLSLAYREEAVENRNLESRFEYHAICVFILLMMACDRIRD